jgi:hypothetical protein
LILGQLVLKDFPVRITLEFAHARFVPVPRRPLRCFVR